MNPHRRTLLAPSAALGAMILGLGALAASSVGIGGLRGLGFALLGVAGLLAAFIQSRRGLEDVDVEALAQLAIARAELAASNGTAAATAAARAVAASTTSRTRNRALTTLAWAALDQGYPETAKAALDRIKPSYALDIYCFAAVQSARGRNDLAIQALEVARASSSLTCEGAKLLVECHFHAHGIESAVASAIHNRNVLGASNCEHVVAAARAAGADKAATALASLLRQETPPVRPVVDAHAR